MPNEVPVMSNEVPVQPYQTRQLLRVAVAAGAVAFAAGLIVARLDDDEMLRGLPRTALAVTAVALLLWVSEIRLEHRLSQMRTEQAAFQARMELMLDERLERQRRWRAYADALSDLSGVDGETSTDSGRMPPRP